MTIEDLKTRLRTGEDSRTEFKSVASGAFDAEDIAKEICAFANSGGGDVFIGVEDDGTVSGVGTAKDAERVQRRITQLCSDSVVPPLRVRLVVEEVQRALVVVVRVPGYLPGRPFRGRSKYFVRDGPVSREARPDELKAIAVSADTHHYDEEPVDAAKRDDLDPKLVDELLHEAYPRLRPGQQEEHLHAIKAIAEDGTPTVAGVLLFSREPQRFLIDAYISAVRFPGTTIGRKFTDRREITGPLIDQLDGSLAFLLRHIAAPAELEGTQRTEHGIPEGVWREAIVNALCHRDYSVNSQIKLYVFDDRVEIINPGVLLNRLTVEGIRRGGISQRRNPYLAAVLGRLGRAENIGMGVPEMLRLADEAGYPEPQVELGDGQFRLVVRTLPETE